MEPSNPTSGTPLRVPTTARVVACVVAVGFIVVNVVLVLRATGGHFSYTLDDPYIHLRLSQQLTHGTYGINRGEFAAPSSSVLWPLLLVPTARTPLHTWTPLIINTVAAGATAWLLAASAELLASARSRSTTIATTVIALVLLFFVNGPAVALTGMEHSVHVLVAVYLAFCLCRIALDPDGAVPRWLLPVALVICGLIRYEGMLLVAAVVVGLWVLAAPKPVRIRALVAAGIAVLGNVAFSIFLLAFGHPALPSSVLAKSSLALTRTQGGAGGSGGLGAMLSAVGDKVEDKLASGSQVLILLVAVIVIVLLVSRVSGGPLRRSPAVRLLVPAVLVIAGHAALGDDGWFGRYQLYAVSFCLVLLLGAAAQVARSVEGPAPTWVPWAAVGALALMVPSFLPLLRPAAQSVEASRWIYQQDYQLHRFVDDHWRAPIAVNDLGWISYGNDHEVLDLLGLGSQESLDARLAGEPGWMARVMREHDVHLAAIYPQWFEGSVPDSWTPVACMVSSPAGTTGNDEVTIYATDAGTARRAERELAAFAAQLQREGNENTTILATCPGG